MTGPVETELDRILNEVFASVFAGWTPRQLDSAKADRDAWEAFIRRRQHDAMQANRLRAIRFMASLGSSVGHIASVMNLDHYLVRRLVRAHGIRITGENQR